jgi:chromosome partitioning protein
MAVIVVASNKGGVGKTTISLLLAEELARRDHSVAVIEADPERHIAKYLAKREADDLPLNFELFSDEDPDTLGKTIKAAEAQHELVVVDLPGYADLRFTRAAARANLMLIPMKPSVMDNNSATNAINQIAIEEDHLERRIPHRIVLNMVTNAAKKEKADFIDRTEKALRRHFADQKYPKMTAELTLRRSPFVNFYSYYNTLPEIMSMGRNQSVENGFAEIVALADETLSVLSESAKAGERPDAAEARA